MNRNLPSSPSMGILVRVWYCSDKSQKASWLTIRSCSKIKSDTKKTWAQILEMARSSTPIRAWIRTSMVMSLDWERWLHPSLPASAERSWPIVGVLGAHLGWSSTRSNWRMVIICFNINFEYSWHCLWNHHPVEAMISLEWKKQRNFWFAINLKWLSLIVGVDHFRTVK